MLEPYALGKLIGQLLQIADQHIGDPDAGSTPALRARTSALPSGYATSLLRHSGCGMLSRRPAISWACRRVRRLERRSSWRMWRMVRKTLRASRNGCAG